MTKPEVGKRYRVTLEGEVTSFRGTMTEVLGPGGYALAPADALFEEIGTPAEEKTLLAELADGQKEWNRKVAAQALREAADELGKALRSSREVVRWLRARADALIAPPEPELPEEPPVGSVVLDRFGNAWQRHGGGRWQRNIDGSCTWTDLINEYGPLTLLVPQREDAPEPVEAEPDWRPGDVVEDASGDVFMRIWNQAYLREQWMSHRCISVGEDRPVRPLRVIHRAGESE